MEGGWSGLEGGKTDGMRYDEKRKSNIQVVGGGGGNLFCFYLSLLSRSSLLMKKKKIKNKHWQIQFFLAFWFFEFRGKRETLMISWGVLQPNGDMEAPESKGNNTRAPSWVGLRSYVKRNDRIRKTQQRNRNDWLVSGTSSQPGGYRFRWRSLREMSFFFSVLRSGEGGRAREGEDKRKKKAKRHRKAISFEWKKKEPEEISGVVLFFLKMTNNHE